MTSMYGEMGYQEWATVMAALEGDESEVEEARFLMIKYAPADWPCPSEVPGLVAAGLMELRSDETDAA